MKRITSAAFLLVSFLLAGEALSQTTVGCTSNDLGPSNFLPILDPWFALRNTRVIVTTVTINGKFAFTAKVTGGEGEVTAGSIPAAYVPHPDDVAGSVEQLCNGTILAPHAMTRARPRASAGTSMFGQAAGPDAWGDFNGDGILDSAALNGTSIAITLFNVDGTTLSQSTVRLPSGFSLGGGMIVSADFNGDGNMDLALAQDGPPNSSAGGAVLILPGNGDGTFRAPVTVPVNVAVHNLAAMSLGVGDFNRDGIPDLAVGGVAQSGDFTVGITQIRELQVLLGNGDGTFATPLNYNVSAQSIVSADFNSDGVPDLAVLDAQRPAGDEVWLFPGNGDGSFRAPSGTLTGTQNGYLAYADLNHDGMMDLLVSGRQSNGFATLFGNGDGTFQPPTLHAAGMQVSPNSVAPLPLDDGNTLLFTYDAFTGAMVVATANPDGVVNAPVIQPLGTKLTAIGTADVNGDQLPDLLVLESMIWNNLNPRLLGNLYVMTGIGTGQFSAPTAYPLGRNPTALAAGDLNRDGSVDAVVADATGIDVLLGTGTGGFAPMKIYPSASGQLSSVALADFNLDGNLDVIATSLNSLSLFLGQGDGTFTAETVIPLDQANSSLLGTVLVADLNGDGHPDLIVGSNPQPPLGGFSGPPPPGTISILLGAGDGTFSSPMNVVLAAGFAGGLAVADINGDGIPDVIAGTSQGRVAVYLGNGDGSFASPMQSKTATLATLLSVTDLDGDGKPDLIVGECCAVAEPSYMLGNGDGTFLAETRFPDGPGTRGVAVADFDGDGHPDLATVGDSGGVPYLGFLTVLMNGFQTAAIDSAKRSPAAGK